jgi:tetratricopeptide (TPR) repeat protein
MRLWPPANGLSTLRRLARPALLAAALGLGACAHPPPAEVAAELLRDDLFPPARVRIDAAEVFAMSEAMRAFAEQRLRAAQGRRDPRRALIDALYEVRDGLRLGYDSELTRTAAEAFERRAGNCLSLVVLTAAFARHLELPVTFQSVYTDLEYSRSGDLFVAAAHVNIALGRPGAIDPREAHWMTVDFVPQEQLRGARTSPLSEQTVVAMFMNNRAAEALAGGRVSEAYWWAREAVRTDGRYLPGINTLGVVYTRAGRFGEAERALRHVLAVEDDDINALTNLINLYERDGRAGAAAPLKARLATLQPVPPLHWLDRGREALGRGELQAARDFLQRELRRQPYHHEVHFGLAQAYLGLGDRRAAEQHLSKARDNSPTLGQHALYAGKLNRLRDSSSARTTGS